MQRCGVKTKGKGVLATSISNHTKLRAKLCVDTAAQLMALHASAKLPVTTSDNNMLHLAEPASARGQGVQAQMQQCHVPRTTTATASVSLLYHPSPLVLTPRQTFWGPPGMRSSTHIPNMNH